VYLFGLATSHMGFQRGRRYMYVLYLGVMDLHYDYILEASRGAQWIDRHLVSLFS
jgi:hypothetical protein